MNARMWKNLFLACLAVSFTVNSILMLAKTFSLDKSDSKTACEEQKDTMLKTIRLLQDNCNVKNKHQQFQQSIVDKTDQSTMRRSSIVIDKEEVRLLGNARANKGFLTIGIPTVKRAKGSYLQSTLDSIIEHTSADERKNIVVVVFLADMDVEIKSQTVEILKQKYSQYMWNGFLEVIEAPQSFYPPLENLKQKYGDSQDRIRWRSKQVVDYAFLFSYCQDISTYYLQLEDDVVSSPNFISSIRVFIESQDHPWVTLEFSELGFIGKLYHSTDLPKLSEFALLFYDEQPVDYLLRYHLAVMGQTKTLIHLPSLFQHVGQESSLKEKQQDLMDRFFNAGSLQYNADNPPATVYSSMRAFSMYLPQLAYKSQPGYFWGVAPKTGDSIFVVFETAVKLTRVIFETGTEDHKDDFLRNGRLEASSQLIGQTEKQLPVCSDYVYLGSFDNGKVDVSDVQKKTEQAVKCLRVSVTEDQVAWMILKEIAVWILK
ncbi:alpha-1,3-mannosyl-glycoprotein 4-beta-N-acetylglucosaminyltransferase C-like [Ptychodera flava]|uniref:alpha-1,3-mannosyl-glycoprotein 4-beta-N-acetylglucosaminyltransferase C-like n=1 Tax=Ptychodera flava TaxID=63121 RepID=UPI00396AAF7D